MDNWEYKVLNLCVTMRDYNDNRGGWTSERIDVETELNKLGNEGWDVVGVTYDIPQIILKRRK